MPEELDPAWEYWTPDPEIDEVMRYTNVDIIATIIEFNGGKIRDGIRFGKGNPNRPYGKIAREKISILESTERCTVCGDFFYRTANHQKYCSRQCKRESWYGRSYSARTCEACNKYYMPKYYKQRFCSTLCTPQRKRILVPIPCKRCGLQFQPLAKRTRYCGLKCGRAGNGAKRTLDDRKCACGNVFRPHRNSTYFCSRSCGAKNRGKR